MPLGAEASRVAAAPSATTRRSGTWLMVNTFVGFNLDRRCRSGAYRALGRGLMETALTTVVRPHGVRAQAPHAMRRQRGNPLQQ